MSGDRKMETRIFCGYCGQEIGKGKGKLTGITIQKFKVLLTPPKIPQLHGLTVTATVNICIRCVDNIANTLNTAEMSAVLAKRIN